VPCCVLYLHGYVGDEATSVVNLGIFEYSCCTAVMKYERGLHGRKSGTGDHVDVKFICNK
jgi:hypothetical protein